MEFKYKVGDKVRILDGNYIDGYEGTWVSDMNAYIGCVCTVKRRCVYGKKPAYKINDAGGFTYDERGLELVSDTCAFANVGMPEIKNVIFNKPLTIIIWADGTKTFVRCGDDDVYDPEKGMAMAITKKAYGNKYRSNNIIGEWVEKRSAK